MQYGFTDKADDLKVGQKVRYRNAPMNHETPIDGRVTEVVEIQKYRSRTTGNQCVKLKGDVWIRDANELVPA